MEYILFIIIAYLLGSIPSALIIGKMKYGIDIREHGSGNLGATNTFRVLGKKAGIVVTLADIFKGTLATLIPLFVAYFIDIDVSRLFIGLFAVLGHTFPVFAGFKGGKAVATSAGIILGVAPLLFLTLFISFILLIMITKYVSLASMLSAIIASVISYYSDDLLLFIVILSLTVFVWYRHLDNIKRIFNGTEPKVYLFKTK